MDRIVLKSKIHRAKVTKVDPDYVGSITIDEVLMEKADLWPGEKVLVADLTNGERLETYVIRGGRNSGIICMNGPASRLIKVGDLVIIMAFCVTSKKIKPKNILVDKNNSFVKYI
jgi:aspartate 1-decarboxylase